MAPEDAAGQPWLSVVVPAFNEEANLERAVRSLLDELEGRSHPYEIVIVDDGSTDRTGEVASGLADRHPAVSALQQENQGIGGAFRSGLLASRGEYILLWPADMVCREGDLEVYLAASGRADVIVGCRRRRVGYNPLMRFNAALYPYLVRILFGLALTDVNWICLYRASLLRAIDISCQGIPMLAEILVKIRDRGGSFLEVESEMRARQGGAASAARPRVMIATLLGLLRFWWRWRRGA
jgi:glycosyltransferase involved in cell wall biosynthesis